MTEIRTAFAAIFEPWGLELPSDAEIRARGSVPNKQGWYIRYRFGRVGEREHMDIFACHRMTNDRLYRIHEDGRTELLGASADLLASTPAGRLHEEEFRRKVKEHGF